MRILLDTSALYVAAGLSDVAFSAKVRRLLEDPETERLLSAASVMEVAIKSDKGLSEMKREHMEKAVVDLQLTLIAFTPQHALRLFGLPPHHRDPFDRILIATALSEDIPIISGDHQFRKYRGLRVIW